jgi:hypothetical protein
MRPRSVALTPAPGAVAVTFGAVATQSRCQAVWECLHAQSQYWSAIVDGVCVQRGDCTRVDAIDRVAKLRIVARALR